MKDINFKDLDPLFKEALYLVVETRKASTTFLQRKLNTGYARSAKILDEMEEMGIIGPSSGIKPRDILVKLKDINFDDVDDLVKKAVYRQKIIEIKRFIRRFFRVLGVALFLYILKLIFGFEVVILFGLAVIIEYLISGQSFYSVF